jgi:inner membrane protein
VKITRAHSPVCCVALALAAPALILLIDVALRREPHRAVAALLDESAHAATALLLLHAFHPRTSRQAALAVGLAAILIDADHIPLDFFGWQFLTLGTARPITHCLLSVAACLALARGLPGRHRHIAIAVAFGLAAHLSRDMATGGVPLLWPLTSAASRYPYPAYVAILTVAASVVARRELCPRSA